MSSGYSKKKKRVQFPLLKGSVYCLQIKIKVDKGDEQQEEAAEAEEMKNVKKEEGDDGPVKNEAPETGIQADAEMGRLVMTIDGVQKQLPFRQRDLLSTATMLVGDKVRSERSPSHLQRQSSRFTPQFHADM